MSGIVLVIIAIIIIVIFSIDQKRKINVIAFRVDASTKVLLRLSDLNSTAIAHAGYARSYSLTGDKRSREAMQFTAKKLESALDTLRNLLKNKPAHHAKADSLVKYVNKRISLSNEVIALGNEKGIAATSALYQTGAGRDYNNQILLITDQIQDIEMDSLEQDQKNNADSIRTLNFYLFGLLVIILVLTLFIILKIRFDISTRRKIEDKLNKFNEELEEQVRVKAEKIRENEERYRTLTGIYQTTPEGTILACNDTFAKILGYDSNKELLQKNALLFYFSDSDRNSFIASLLKKGKLNNKEFMLKHKDGSPVYVLENCSLLKDSVTGGQKIEGVLVDITERKKAEEALRESEETFRRLFNESTDSILLLGETGFTDCNQSAVSTFGYSSKQEVLNKQPWDISPEKQPDGRLSTEKAGAMIAKSLQHGYNRFEWIHTKSDGTEFPVEVMLTPIIVRGKQSFYALLRDITESKKAKKALEENEYLLRESQAIARLGSYAWDLSKGIWSSSKILDDIFGIDENYIRSFKGWIALIHSDWVEMMSKYVTEKILGKHLRFDKEYKIIRNDNGKECWVHGLGELVYDNNKQPIKLIGTISDITERKKVEEALKESEFQFRKVTENPMIGVAWASPEGKLIKANSTFCKMLGYSLEELKNIHFGEFTHPMDTEKELPLIEQIIQGKIDHYQMEKRYKTKQGVYIWVELNLSSYRKAADNSIEFFIGIVKDIDEKKKAEEAILVSEERYRSIIEQASDFIMITDKRGYFIDTNSNFYKTFGYKKDELSRLNINILIDSEQLKSEPVRFDLLMKGQTVLRERRMIDRNGTIIDVEANEKMLPDGRILIIARDIRDRKKAEEEMLKINARFQMLSKATSDIVWDWDLKEDLLWWNDNYYSNLGIKKEKEIVHINDWYKRIHPDDLERVRNKIQVAIKGDAAYWSDEYRFQKADGSYLHFLDRGYIIRNQNNEPLRMIGSMVNMTPVYSAQQKVAESENRLRTIFETEPECIKLLNSNNELLDMNPAGLAMIEADNLEIVKGKSVLGIVSPDYRKVFANLTRDIFKGKTGTLEFEIIGLQGTHRWLETHAVPMRDAEGTIIALLGVTRNITERKLAEEAVKQSEEKYRIIIEQAPDGIFIVRQDTFIIDVNKSGCRMIGYGKDELLKMKFTELIAPENIRDKPIRMSELNTGKTVLSERKLLRKDGVEILVEISAKLRPDGLYQSFIRDITDRKVAQQAVKISEEKYRTLVEQAVDAIALYDETGRILDVNSGSSELLGYTKKELSGMALGSILLPEDLLENPVRYDVLQNGKSTVKQRRMKKKDGTIVETEVRSQQLPDGRFLSVIRDLTERIKTEQELDASYKSIRKLTRHLQNIREEERTNMAREIHDELGQQLTVLKMDASWLSKKIDVSDDMTKEKMKSLITMLDETVKTVRRISSELRPSLLDDLGLLAAMEWQLKEFEKRSEIKTRLTASEAGLHFSNTVKTALFRIFQESLTNVARHSGAKKVLVNLKLKNNNFVVSIIDDGKGFDKQKIAEKRTLGILGMQERTSMIGGTYEITSSPGKGTAVIVSIPVSMLSQN